MDALSALNQAFISNITGGNLPKALIVPPLTWHQALKQQAEHCRAHYGADALFSPHEPRQHFLFQGVPAVCGPADATNITAELRQRAAPVDQ